MPVEVKDGAARRLVNVVFNSLDVIMDIVLV
jgi:hypothetical protein